MKLKTKKINGIRLEVGDFISISEEESIVNGGTIFNDEIFGLVKNKLGMITGFPNNEKEMVEVTYLLSDKSSSSMSPVVITIKMNDNVNIETARVYSQKDLISFYYIRDLLNLLFLDLVNGSKDTESFEVSSRTKSWMCDNLESFVLGLIEHKNNKKVHCKKSKSTTINEINELLDSLGQLKDSLKHP